MATCRQKHFESEKKRFQVWSLFFGGEGLHKSTFLYIFERFLEICLKKKTKLPKETNFLKKNDSFKKVFQFIKIDVLLDENFQKP